MPGSESSAPLGLGARGLRLRPWGYPGLQGWEGPICTHSPHALGPSRSRVSWGWGGGFVPGRQTREQLRPAWSTAPTGGSRLRPGCPIPMPRLLKVSGARAPPAEAGSQVGSCDVNGALQASVSWGCCRKAGVSGGLGARILVSHRRLVPCAEWGGAPEGGPGLSPPCLLVWAMDPGKL